MTGPADSSWTFISDHQRQTAGGGLSNFSRLRVRLHAEERVSICIELFPANFSNLSYIRKILRNQPANGEVQNGNFRLERDEGWFAACSLHFHNFRRFSHYLTPPRTSYTPTAGLNHFSIYFLDLSSENQPHSQYLLRIGERPQRKGLRIGTWCMRQINSPINEEKLLPSKLTVVHFRWLPTERTE